MTDPDTNGDSQARNKKPLYIGCAAIVVILLGCGGFLTLMVSLSETVTESHDRRRAALIGDWIVGLEGSHGAAVDWIGADSLREGDYRFSDYLRFSDDGRYRRTTLVFHGDVCYALHDSGRWDPDKDSERNYVQFDSEQTDFGCYRIEAADTLRLMVSLALIAEVHLAAKRPWDVDAGSDPNVSELEAVARDRTSYQIEMKAVDEQVLELDLDEGTALRRVYRPYHRVTE